MLKGLKHPVSLIDVYPTLIDYCNLKGSTVKGSKGGELGGFHLGLSNPKVKSWNGQVPLIVVGNYGKKLNKYHQNYTKNY